jgi:hypothetical protein
MGLHVSNSIDLGQVGFDASVADDEVEEFPGWDTENTLGGVEFPFEFLMIFKHLSQVSDELIM